VYLVLQPATYQRPVLAESATNRLGRRGTEQKWTRDIRWLRRPRQPRLTFLAAL